MTRNEFLILQKKYSDNGISLTRRKNGFYIAGRFAPVEGAWYQTVKTFNQDLIRNIELVISQFDKMAKDI